MDGAGRYGGINIVDIYTGTDDPAPRGEFLDIGKLGEAFRGAFTIVTDLEPVIGNVAVTGFCYSIDESLSQIFPAACWREWTFRAAA